MFRMNRRGQALVEVAIVAPLLLLLLGVSADFGRVFFISNTVTNAAREGALFASHHAAEYSLDAGVTLDSNTRSIIQQEERGSFLAIQCPGALQITISRSGAVVSGPPGIDETVAVTCDVPSLLPFLPLPKTFHTQSQSRSLVVNYDS